MDYIKLRLYVQNLSKILCEKKEFEENDKWYTDLFEVMLSVFHHLLTITSLLLLEFFYFHTQQVISRLSHLKSLSLSRIIFPPTRPVLDLKLTSPIQSPR